MIRESNSNKETSLEFSIPANRGQREFFARDISAFIRQRIIA